MTTAPFLLTSNFSPEHDDDCACPDRAFVLTFDNATADLDTSNNSLLATLSPPPTPTPTATPPPVD